MSGYSSTKLKIGLAGDLQEVLERYVSRIVAGSMLQQTLGSLGLAEAQLHEGSIERVCDALAESAKLFCEAQKVPSLVADLAQLRARRARRA